MREADAALLTRAGPEIGVASTKSFTTQLLALLIFAAKLGSEQKPQNNIIRTKPRVVDWRNVEDYRDSWKKWLK